LKEKNNVEPSAALHRSHSAPHRLNSLKPLWGKNIASEKYLPSQTS